MFPVPPRGPCPCTLLGLCFLCPQEGCVPVLCWGLVSCAPKRAVPLYFAGVLLLVPPRGPCPCTLLGSLPVPPRGPCPCTLLGSCYLCPQEGHAPVLCWGLVSHAPKRAMLLYFAGVLFPVPPRWPCPCTLLGSFFLCPQEGHAPVFCWGLVTCTRSKTVLTPRALPLYPAGALSSAP